MIAEKKIQTVLDTLFTAGAHIGYSKARRHPSMKPFIFGAKNRVEVIDLEKTSVMLDQAKEFVAGLATEGKKILFVGTKAEARQWMREGAESAGLPYITERWIGGLFTNFPEVKKRIAELRDISAKKESGELGGYTKKERLLLDRKLAKLSRDFGGVVDMETTPEAIFVIDPKKEKIAITEAEKLHIPVVALASSDCDVKHLAHPIPGNDASSASIKFFVDEIVFAYRNAPKPKKEEKKEQ